MLDTRNIYPLSDFQRNAKDFISQLKESQKPIVLTVNGKAAMVIQDAIAFQENLDRLKAAEEELDKIDLERLRREAEIGLKDLREGRFTTYTAETIGSLADRIKAEGRAELGLKTSC